MKSYYRCNHLYECVYRVDGILHRYTFDLAALQRLDAADFKAKYGFAQSDIITSRLLPIAGVWYFDFTPLLLFGSLGFLLFIAIPYLADRRRRGRKRFEEIAAARGQTPKFLANLARHASVRTTRASRRRWMLALAIGLAPALMPAAPVNAYRSLHVNLGSRTFAGKTESRSCSVSTREIGIGRPWMMVSHTTLVFSFDRLSGSTATTDTFDYDEYRRMSDEAFEARFGVEKDDGHFIQDLGDYVGWRSNPAPLLLFPPVGYVLVLLIPGMVRRRRIWWRFVEGHCLNCGYDLYTLVSERCPECGQIAVLDGIGTRKTDAAAHTQLIGAAHLDASRH